MVTVIIATYNGSKTLPLVLDSYTRLEPPAGGWKLVVVDNASTDSSSEVINSYAKVLPLTYLYEAKQGKNVALNSALSTIEGDLVVFSDDDAIPEANWLVELVDCAIKHPEYTIIGGLIVPRWPFTPHDWIFDWVPLGVTYAIHETVETGPIPPSIIWGSNMLVRASVFVDGTRFDESIGPSGNQYPMGSETSFNEMLGSRGHLAWFCSSAVVEHIIRPHQLEEKWVLERAYKYGRGQYLKEKVDCPAEMPMWRGIPRWKWRKLLSQHLRYWRARIKADQSEQFRSQWEIRYLQGYIYQASLK